MMMAIQKILLSGFKFVVGVWDGLDECEISRPEILFSPPLRESTVISVISDIIGCFLCIRAVLN